MYKVYLKPGKEESLRRLHPWVFSGAVARLDGEPDEGDLVEVYTAQREFVARGHWQIGSIVVRVLTFNPEEAIDAAFWHRRLEAALQVRRSIGLTDRQGHDTYRLVHGEGDGLPGLVIDIYGHTAVMQAHSPGMHVCRMDIAHALADVMNAHTPAITDIVGSSAPSRKATQEGQPLTAIYYKSETTLPYKADLFPENGFLMGQSSNNVAHENGLSFHIDWLKGQKTGFFVDQRDNRSLLERYSRGRQVLNMFCYTGGFSVYALRGGARLVHSVDSSAKAIDLTNQNVALNFLNDPRHQAFAEDAFRFLDRMDSTTYDLIILDPPAFAKHRDALRNALQGYRKLNAKAFEKIRPGGILFTFSCSQAVSREQFRTSVFTAAALSGRSVRILHQLTQPADHPVSIYHPEGEYLKGLVLYVE